ncbi:MAG: hypothetical protein VB085_05810 [Peptococcaceae bacterium]|nr:hypothetical protein [Peptococcaceae bacterium]
MYQAVMDIGTNTSRLIVVRTEEGRDETVTRDILTTRIGQGLGGGHLKITEEAARRTLEGLKGFRDKMAAYPVERVWLIGTQALREASNREDFRALVRRELGWELLVISGKAEAYLSYTGAASVLVKPGESALVLDIGGGSTELMASAGQNISGASAPIGGLRLLEQPLSQPQILSCLQAGWQGLEVPEEGPLIGVGGTATTLGAIALKMKRYDADALAGTRISRRQAAETIKLLEAMTPAERLALPGMMPGREDILPWGLRILLEAMTYCRREELLICDRDLMYGILRLSGPEDLPRIS